MVLLRVAVRAELKCLSIHNHPLDALLPYDIATLLTLLESTNLDRQGFMAVLGWIVIAAPC